MRGHLVMMVRIVCCLLYNALEAAHLDRGVSASIVLHEVIHVVPVVVSVLHDGFVCLERKKVQYLFLYNS